MTRSRRGATIGGLFISGLVPIVVESDGETKSFRRLDTREIIYEGDFEILRQMPVLYMKPEETPPQMGAYFHYYGLDFNEMPEEVNAVLLSRRYIIQDGQEVYAGQYCHISPRPS